MNKRMSDSYTEQVQILTQANINGYNRLFGGQLMQWIDVVAAVVARRHSGCNVTTAAVDSLRFEGAGHPNDTILLIGRVTYVGHTSMEVCVETYVESLSGEKTRINKAYLVMVALDENEKPVEVPGLVVETHRQRMDWEAGEKRYEYRRNLRRQQTP